MCRWTAALNDVLSEMLEMLERGELDLLGAMNYSDALAEIYDYPGYSYGTSYSVLAVLDESEITESNSPSAGCCGWR